MGILEELVDRTSNLSPSLATILLFLLLAIIHIATSKRPYPNLPIINPDVQGFQRLLPASIHWFFSATKTIHKGLVHSPSCFQINVGSKYKIIIPNRFAGELRNHADLSFPEAFAEDLLVNYPGFDGNRAGLQNETFIQDVVRIKLTQSLGAVTEDLVHETELAMKVNFGAGEEWRGVVLRPHILDVVAKLSSRVFLGEDLAHDERWLAIARDYTIDSFSGARQLLLWPALVRPVVHWFVPTCIRLRREVRDARRLIASEVEQRRQRAEMALARGEKVQKKADAIAWMAEIADGKKIDYVGAQLSLTQAAIHTTAETTVQCIRRLCLDPEAVELLREEVERVLHENGWTRVALQKMTLVDSFLKEVQRVDGMSSVSMQRRARKDIRLSDGTILPKGACIMVADNGADDSDFYPQPQVFDIRRYQKLRQQPGQEHRHQFVTATADNMGFGYGQHACPGRFFASNEIKIFLASFLLRYDVRLDPNAEDDAHTSFMQLAAGKMVDPKFRVQLRLRVAEE